MPCLLRRLRLGLSGLHTFGDLVLTAAELDGRTARLTVRFDSDLISCTRGPDGQVVEGDPTEVQTIRDAYAEAIRSRYFFYSYGDCMFLTNKGAR